MLVKVRFYIERRIIIKEKVINFEPIQTKDENTDIYYTHGRVELFDSWCEGETELYSVNIGANIALDKIDFDDFIKELNQLFGKYAK